MTMPEEPAVPSQTAPAAPNLVEVVGPYLLGLQDYLNDHSRLSGAAADLLSPLLDQEAQRDRPYPIYAAYQLLERLQDIQIEALEELAALCERLGVRRG